MSERNLRKTRVGDILFNGSYTHGVIELVNGELETQIK